LSFHFKRPRNFIAALSFSLLFSTQCYAANPAMKQGIAEYRSGNYSSAAEHLSAALATEFNDPTIHYYLGNCYMYLKQLESATREYRIAYALQPDGEIARYAKQALARLGVDADHAPSSAASLFVKLPHQELKIDAKLAAALDPKVLQALRASMPVIMPEGPTLPAAPSIPGGIPPHAGVVVPLDTAWHCGSKFVSAKLPEPTDEGSPWFIVPDWFAGTWVEANETLMPIVRTEYDADRSTEQSVHRLEQNQHFGEVRDKTGAIWSHPIVPEVFQRKSGGDLIVQILVGVRPLNADADMVRMLFQWVTLQVNSKSIIHCVVQSEQISSFVPVGDDYCQETESIREFNQYGQPQRLFQYRCYLKRIHKPVLPLVTSERNYLALFRKYLTDHKMLNLMP
jgi:tetratricopeptide (TPR) repeat protein